MFCSQCGEQVPEGANFCPSCGAPVAESTVAEGSDTTTSSLEVGAFDPEHDVDDLPQLEPGTGMLVVVRGPNAGSRFLLDRERTSIGRHPESDIFLDDVTVSRRHAIVSREEKQMVVEDNGSLNGTYVNGDRVDRRELATGDELQIGRFKVLFVGDPGLTLGDLS
ncbi:MAG: FHA domain-containing protein [Nitriliruptoraceae bacterium]